MTLAEQLIQQGVQQGRHQGINEGMQQGMLQGMERGMLQGIQQKGLEIARQMLHKGFDRTLIQEFTHLPDEELEKLLETIE